MAKALFSCGTQQVTPGRQDSPILPAQVANHSAGFGSSCPLTEPAIYKSEIFIDLNLGEKIVTLFALEFHELIADSAFSLINYLLVEIESD